MAEDRDRQRAMVDALIGPLPIHDCPPDEIVSAAVGWARGAASHGHPGDILRLAGILMLRAASVEDDRESLAHQAEALMVLNDLADTGNEDAAQLIYQVAGNVEPEAFALATGKTHHG